MLACLHEIHPSRALRLVDLRRPQSACVYRRLSQYSSPTEPRHEPVRSPPAPHPPVSSSQHPQRLENIQDEHYRAKGRALLRSLLRECSYFPDAFARAEIYRQITTRFRRHKTFSAQQLADRRHLKGHARGRQVLHNLERANNGNARILRRFLIQVHGRIGPRKYELLRPLLPIQQAQADERSRRVDKLVTADTSDVHSPISSFPSKDISDQSKSQHVPDFTPQLKALVARQNIKSFDSVHSFHPKRPGKLEPILPELNKWYQPLPGSRVKNMTRKWYANLLDRILAPLPLKEWLHIFEIASGSTEIHQPQRRSSQQKNKPSALELTAIKGKVDDCDMMARREHKLKPKMLQRAWIETFATCPVMIWDQHNQQWLVYWGDEALANHSIVEKVREEYSQDDEQIESTA